MKKAYITISLLLLTSCTSMEDFHAMNPDERAESVCNATSGYRQRKQSLTELNNEIAEKENLLATGYRVFEACRVVTVAIPGETVSCDGLEKKELKTCRKANTAATQQQRRICEQSAVPIDYNYELSVLRDLKMSRENALELHQIQTDNCRSRARSLSAEDAYLLYEDNMEP